MFTDKVKSLNYPGAIVYAVGENSWDELIDGNYVLTSYSENWNHSAWTRLAEQGDLSDTANYVNGEDLAYVKTLEEVYGGIKK